MEAQSAELRTEPVIALVGSVGGLEAVTSILGGLPADLGACVIVLIHQAPDRESELVELLARRTELPVALAAHEGRLRPGHVAVIPPGKHLLIRPDGGTLLIMSGASPPSRPSADLLLTTMATALGPRAIAVVLSGGGHDGATGATAVHVCGGTVLATDEATSHAFSMPQATIERDSAIDHVVALEDMPGLLAELVSAPTRR